MSQQTLTNLELTQLMVTCANEGQEPLKAFTTCSKAGMSGIKRDAFETEYAQLVGSPFLRKLKLRSAKEDALKTALAEAVMASDPPEEEALELAQLLTNARNTPSLVPVLLDALDAVSVDTATLRAEYAVLWPSKEE